MLADYFHEGSNGSPSCHVALHLVLKLTIEKSISMYFSPTHNTFLCDIPLEDRRLVFMSLTDILYLFYFAILVSSNILLLGQYMFLITLNFSEFSFADCFSFKFFIISILVLHQSINLQYLFPLLRLYLS